MGESQRIKVGDWTVTPAQDLLQRAGKSIRIKPRTMDVLVYLASHAGEVISAEELINSVWQGRVVGDGTVYQNITQLRQALGDSTEEARFIETIPKRGYRLVAPVTTLEPEPKQEASQRAVRELGSRKLGLAIAVLIAVTAVVVRYVPDGPTSPSVEGQSSLAILPFVNQSAAEENAEFFADGIHDELLTQLSKIRSLKVISRTSVEEYRNTSKNMRQIGRELGVATLLEGRVQRAGDMVRINLQLIDAETDENLWAETYNSEITAENIFTIQSEMATAIAEALQATLSPQEVARLNEVPTRNTRAYDFYLSGNEFFRRSDQRTSLPLAVQMYEQAVEEDPEFGLALARLSIAHGQMYWFGFDQTESRLSMAEEAVQRALVLVPNLPVAHLAFGYYHYRGFRNYDRALQEFDIAEQESPGDSELFEARSYIYRRVGQWDESLESMALAIELDPRNTNLFFQQAGTYSIRRDYAAAGEHLERALEIAPDHVEAYALRAQTPLRRSGEIALLKVAAENPPMEIGIKRQWLGWYAAIYERDFDTALEYLDDWDIDVFEGQWESVPKSSFYGVTHGLAQQPELAEPHFQSARVQIEARLEVDPTDPRLYIALGEVLAGTGENEAALRAVDQAMNLLSTSTDTFDGPVYRLATIIRVFVPAGDFDSAIEALDAYLAAPGRWSIEGLLPDPRLDPIRDDPRFQVLVDKYSRQ